MKRRSFFASLTGLVAAFAPRLASALPASSPAKREPRAGRGYHVLEVPIAGFQYHAGERIWHALALGGALDLVREPTNPFDARAVRVDWQGLKLGYVPRHKNEAIANLLDQGAVAQARIVALNPGPNPWERVAISIEIRLPD